MGCYLSKPVTDKVCENFDKENIRVGTCSMQETVFNYILLYILSQDSCSLLLTSQGISVRILQGLLSYYVAYISLYSLYNL